MMEKKNVHIMYGFITGIVMVITSLIIYITDISFKPGGEKTIYVVYLPFLVGIISNSMAYSKANNSFVTFGNIFGSCFKATMIIILVMIGWGIISSVVFPEMKEKTLRKIQETLMKSQKMTDEQIDAYMSFMTKHWNTIVIGGTVLYNLFFGAIFSLIGGLAAKKNAVQPTADNF